MRSMPRRYNLDNNATPTPISELEINRVPTILERSPTKVGWRSVVTKRYEIDGRVFEALVDGQGNHNSVGTIFVDTSNYMIRAVSQDRFFSRNGYPTRSIEVISGFIDDNETPLEAAQREMAEEAGVRAYETIIDLGRYARGTNKADEKHCFFVESHGGYTHTQDLDKGEYLSTASISPERLLEVTLSGRNDNARIVMRSLGLLSDIIARRDNIKLEKDQLAPSLVAVLYGLTTNEAQEDSSTLSPLPSYLPENDTYIEIKGRRTVRRSYDYGNEGGVHTYDIFDSDPAVAIVALTSDHGVITIDQYGFGPERILNEMPGDHLARDTTGIISTTYEDPFTATRRCLKSIGYTPTGNIVYTGTGPIDAYDNLECICMIASGCEKVSEGALERAKGQLGIGVLSIEEFVANAAKGNTTRELSVLKALPALNEAVIARDDLKLAGLELAPSLVRALRGEVS